MRWLDGLTDSMVISYSKLWEMVKISKAWVCGPWGGSEQDAERLSSSTVLVCLVL